MPNPFTTTTREGLERLLAYCQQRMLELPNDDRRFVEFFFIARDCEQKLAEQS